MTLRDRANSAPATALRSTAPFISTCGPMLDVSRPSDAAGLMDRMYRRQRHIYDLTRKFYLLGRDQMIDTLAPPLDGRGLEIGCGTGRTLIRAALKYAQMRVYGVDISEEMLSTARVQIERAGLE